ncbi:hypothetical protein ACFQ7N_10280 [Streptomyces niveus]|uniref:hypothetical protein n=1 Tax=Streptomyces niveus TaxID=193462 RepID=UPI00368ED3A9
MHLRGVSLSAFDVPALAIDLTNRRPGAYGTDRERRWAALDFVTGLRVHDEDSPWSTASTR